MPRLCLGVVLALMLALCAAPGLADDQERELNQQELAQAQAAQAEMEAQIKAFVQGRLQSARPLGATVSFTGNFFAKDKSSDPNHACEKVRRQIEAQIKAWLQGYIDQGYLPLNTPEPAYTYKYKWNISNFKFKIRVWVTLTVWFQKMPG